MALLISASGDDAVVLGTAAAFSKQASALAAHAAAVAAAPGRAGGPRVTALAARLEAGLRPNGAGDVGADGYGYGPPLLSPNARLTTALLDWSAGCPDTAVRALDHVVAAALQEFRALQVPLRGLLRPPRCRHKALPR
jgi:hypothetical protein